MTIEQTVTTVEGSFTIDAWDQQDRPAREDKPDVGHSWATARVTKTFGGGLTGSSTAELMLLGTASGARAYCGFEQVSGTVAGRTGTFVLRHAAEADGAGQWMTWTVVPGSGTGELADVRGEGQITRHDDGSHTYRLDLTLE